MPMPGQRNSLTVKATAVLLYHLFTSLAPPSKSLPFQSLKFCYVGKYLGITAPYFILFFWLCCSACGILVPLPGMKLIASAVKGRSLHGWTARQVPLLFKFSLFPLRVDCCFSVYTLRLIFHVSFIVSFFILSVYFSRFFCFQDLEALPNAAIWKEAGGSGGKRRMGGTVKPADPT